MQRSVLLLLLIGLVLAVLAAFLVIQIARQVAPAPAPAVPQVAVVAATRDIPDQSQIAADAITVRSFPANVVPAGALTSPDQAIGRFASGFIPRDGVVVAGQVALSQRSANLSDRIPPGRVAIWLPLPDLLAGVNVLRPGDRVDILLTLGSAEASSTQTTLQNVEVFAIGQEEAARAAPAATATPTGQAGGQAQRPPAPTGRAVGFLVDHQDAVVIKFVKDSGGTIDLAIRSAEEQQIVRTDPITTESLVERFRFRVPSGVAR